MVYVADRRLACSAEPALAECMFTVVGHALGVACRPVVVNAERAVRVGVYIPDRAVRFQVCELIVIP